MKKIQRTLRKEDSTKLGILYMAFELSQSKWKLALSNGRKIRTVTIDGRDFDQLQKAIDASKSPQSWEKSFWEFEGFCASK